MSRSVPNICKTSGQLGPDEFPADNFSAWSANVNPCPNGQNCAVKKGDQLCAWVADTSNTQGQSGTDFLLGIKCYPSTQCAPGVVFKRADNEIPFDGNPCGPGTVCCRPKNQPAGSTDGAGSPTSPAAPVTLPDPLSGASLPQLIGNVIRTFAGIAGALALLMFVYGGLMWILSGGEKGKVEKAQLILSNASIGLILIFGAYFFTSAIVTGILANPK